MYGLDLDELRAGNLSPWKVAGYVGHLPRGSQCWVMLGGWNAISAEAEATLLIEYRIREALYGMAGGKGRKPEPPDPPEGFDAVQAKRAKQQEKSARAAAVARAWARKYPDKLKKK